MHPEVKKDAPGICPECGMNLLKIKDKKQKKESPNHEEHNKHAGHSLRMFARKFWISLVLTIPIVAYSELPEKFFDVLAPAFPGSGYISLVLGSAVFFYGGWVFIIGAWRELRARLPGMMTLIALAISTAYAYSVYAVFFLRGAHTLFWELATLITVMLLGHYLEMRAVQSTQGALKELSKLLPDVAEVVRGDKTETIQLKDLKLGDIILVRPGGKIAADGRVVEGESETNESMITGESRPNAKRVGSEVIAGTINGDGTLKIEVMKIGEKTFLSGVMRLVAEAQSSKSRLQILSDRAAFYLTLIAVGAGLVTLSAWLILKAGPAFALERVVAVLVIACPHALGLAVPLVASISTTLAAKRGFLVKQRLALEAARNTTLALFDKTGTLTTGEFGVEEIIPFKNFSVDEVLFLAASVDSQSEHFVAKAIVKEAQKRDLILGKVSGFKRLPGKGTTAVIDGKNVLAGGVSILDGQNISIAEEEKRRIEKSSSTGKTVIYVVVNAELAGVIALGDTIREESRQAIKDLKILGIKVGMITGDSEDVAKSVAGELGIDEYFAKVLPAEKSKKVKSLQDKGYVVAMVGDGINDAPALTQADIGIAIGAGTNVAIESAGIILVKNDPRDIVKIIKLSRLTYSKMLQNLFWATSYNIVAIPLAAGVLAGYGILLQPALSALFMSFSTVIVAVNAMLLKRKTI